MRTPTPHSELYAWHTKALRGEKVQTTTEPQCGWFLVRLDWKGRNDPASQYVTSSISMVQPVDEFGELNGDETMIAEISGRPVDVEECWMHSAKRPTCKLEYMRRLEKLL